MNKREIFSIYKEFYEPIKDLSDVQLGKLFRAIFIYNIDGKEPLLPNDLQIAFQFFKGGFKNDKNETSLSKTPLFIMKLTSDQEEFIKIGISNDIKSRMEDFAKIGYSTEIIKLTLFDDRFDAITKREEYSKYFSKMSYEPLIDFQGNGRCFKKDILKDLK